LILGHVAYRPETHRRSI